MGSALSYFCSPSRLSLPSPPPSPSPPPPSPPSLEIKYDVFLNFRGEDTRNSFTSYLYKTFCDKGIDTFIDYRLRRGDEISPSIFQAIEESQISIVVFSENYADSTWCLEELVKILECKKNHGQIVIPVFYEIDPSHVRNLTGSYAVAFAKHEKSFKKNLDKVQQWRCALQTATNLFGFDSRIVKPESVLVEKIAEDALKRLNNMPSSDNKKLVGIESKITDIEVLLGMGDQMNNNVRKVGICGIGGIGKTTLARAIFDKIYCQFEGCYFTDSVREAFEKRELNCLRDNLYLAILGDKDAHIHIFTKKRLHRKKLLIVFDDVTSLRQVEYLIRDLDCFGSGSRIIITSRDHQVLKNCRMDDIYKVEELCYDDALKLFCQFTFKQNYPKVDYKELSKGVVKKVGGVPLALKVLGSFLLDKGKEVWESSIRKLENSLDNDIHDVLKISYDGLHYDQQRIFLDIVCFYKGWDVDLVIAIMDASDFFTANELSALIDKSLIFILDNKLMMHDLLQTMGKMIVRQESIDPGKRTRLFNHNDIYDILTEATGTETVEGISWDMSNSGDIYLHPRAFFNMHNLRFLKFYISNHWRYNNDNNKIHIPQDLTFLLTKLRYFQWERCPLKSLQSNFHFKNLVILELCSSNVEQLWNGVQQFDHLKEIHLNLSQNLIRLPDFRAPKLECISLWGCTGLIELPLSFQHLSCLKHLFLNGCENLPSVAQLPQSLISLHLSSCSKLQRLPELPNNLIRLNLRECSSLIEIPSSIQHLTSLSGLELRGCVSLMSISDCTGLISLRHLYLSHCPKLERLPGIPNNFKKLDFEGCTSLFEIPSSFKHLDKIKSLTLRGCESLTNIPNLIALTSLTRLTIKSCSKLKTLPEFPNSIKRLYLEKIPIEELPPSYLCTLLELSIIDCSRLKSIPNNFCMWKSVRELKLKNLVALFISRYKNGVVGFSLPPSTDFFHSLTELSLSKCGIAEIPDSLGCLTSLKRLELDRNNFERIPESIINLTNLWYLNISYCERLKVLPKLPWTDVAANNCTSLQKLSCPFPYHNFFARRHSRYLLAQFVNCFQLDQNALDGFVEDTQQEIQAQSPSNRQVFDALHPLLVVYYPNSEIPAGFTFQCSGSFIDVKLPVDWIGYNFLCFALCAIVSCHDQSAHPCRYDCFVNYACEVKSNEGRHIRRKMDGWMGKCFDSPARAMRSSHVIIGFGFYFFRELHDNEFTFKFHVSSHGIDIEVCKVEKCGVHLIFGKHLEN